MILVIGPTGCIGRHVVDRLVSSGHPVKCLWHWEREHLVPRRVVISGGDVRNPDSLYEAMRDDDVQTVIHLAGIRRESNEEKFEDVHVAGARNIVEAMKRAKLNRLITVGCLGAEGRSPYPMLRSLGKAEEIFRASGLNFTVLKSAVVYGEGDWLTTWLSNQAKLTPLVMPVPHGGATKLQPIWVGDVAACIERCMSVRSTFRQVVPIGGPKAMTLAEIADVTMRATGRNRRLMRVPTSLTRKVFSFFARFNGALNEDEMDSLVYNRTTEIGGVHRVFGFAPAKMNTKLTFLSPNFEKPPLPIQFRQQPRWNRLSLRN